MDGCIYSHVLSGHTNRVRPRRLRLSDKPHEAILSNTAVLRAVDRHPEHLLTGAIMPGSLCCCVAYISPLGIKRAVCNDLVAADGVAADRLDGDGSTLGRADVSGAGIAFGFESARGAAAASPGAALLGNALVEGGEGGIGVLEPDSRDGWAAGRRLEEGSDGVDAFLLSAAMAVHSDR